MTTDQLTCTWASLARVSLGPAPELTTSDAALLAGWRAAKHKGDYVDALPARDAARLCDLLTAESGATPRPPVLGRPGRRLRGEPDEHERG